MTEKAMNRCKCANVTMGGYENQIVVTAPPHIVAYRHKCNPDLGAQVCLDRCIALEVLGLWAQGITTNGCCCGHNLGKLSPYIGVEPEDVQKMEELGYEHIFDCPFPEYHFHSKSVIDCRDDDLLHHPDSPHQQALEALEGTPIMKLRHMVLENAQEAVDRRLEVERLLVENRELMGAMNNCANELESWVEHHYAGVKHYPSEKRRYDNDIEAVVVARKLLRPLPTPTNFTAPAHQEHAKA